MPAVSSSGVLRVLSAVDSQDVEALRTGSQYRESDIFEENAYLDGVDRRGAGFTRHPLVAVGDEARSILGCSSMLGRAGQNLDRGGGGGDGAREEERHGDEQRRQREHLANVYVDWGRTSTVREASEPAA